jgi:Zn-dependent protease
MSWFVGRGIPKSFVEGELAKFVLGLITVLIFFLSIFIHELAHAYIARKEGIQVLEILLHPFGGVAKLRREPDTPRAEFRIAIAGPIASFLLSAAFFGLWAGSSFLGTNVLSPLLFALFLLNFLLAVFNLFPGYPLDGGRVLRALLWKRGKNLNEATVLTGRFGQIIAVTLIVFGIAVMILGQDTFSALWTVLVGLFLYDAAAKIIHHMNSFENLPVEEVMEFPVSVAPETTVMEFIDNILLLHRKAIFPIAENKELYGFLLLSDIKRTLPKTKWKDTAVKDEMRPVTEDCIIDIDSRVIDAISLMHANGLGVLAVLDGKGDFVGFIELNRLRKRT